MKKNWYAIYTKPNCEKKVAALLAKKKIENYYPLNRVVVNQQSAKKKTVFEPLLSSYVFVHINDTQMELIKKTNCVINFVYWLGKPAVIQNDEIENLQYFTNEYANVKLEKTVVNPNESGRVTSEPHIDIKGKLISVKNTHIELSLPSLGYRIIADVEKYNTEIFNHGFERNKLVS